MQESIRLSKGENLETPASHRHINLFNITSLTSSPTKPYSGKTISEASVEQPTNASTEWLQNTMAIPHLSLAPSNSSKNDSFVVSKCWAQWTDYWSQYDSATTFRWVTVGNTSTTTGTWTVTSISAVYGTSFSTETWKNTLTHTLSADGFTYTTQTEADTGTNPQANLYTISATTSTSTETYTETEYPDETSETSSLTIPTPGCHLPSDPSRLPQCQEAWDDRVSKRVTTLTSSKVSCTELIDVSCSDKDLSYKSDHLSFDLGNSAPSPHCSQASIAPEKCSGLSSSYMSNWLVDRAYPSLGPLGLFNQPASLFQPNYDPMVSVGYQAATIKASNGSTITTSYWPSTSMLAAGCSLGCGQCAITGGTVRLLYWPVTSTVTANESTILLQRTTPLTAFAFGTSFISPTVYVSYASIYASDSCGAIGATHNATFIALSNTQELSSIWVDFPGGGQDLATHTASLNFTDLNSPVPESIYSRQPLCASWTASIYYDYMHDPQNLTNTICPQTGPYEPVLVVPPDHLQTVDPSWAGCSVDIRNLYDPPYALQPAARAAAPVSENDPFSTTRAAPVPYAPPVHPSQTAPQPIATVSVGSQAVGGDPKQPNAGQAFPASTTTLLPTTGQSNSVDPTSQPPANGDLPASSADPAKSPGDPFSGVFGPSPGVAQAHSLDPAVHQTASLDPGYRLPAVSTTSLSRDPSDNNIGHKAGAGIASIPGKENAGFAAFSSPANDAVDSVPSVLVGGAQGAQKMGTQQGGPTVADTHDSPAAGNSESQHSDLQLGSLVIGDPNDSPVTGAPVPQASHLHSQSGVPATDGVGEDAVSGNLVPAYPSPVLAGEDLSAMVASTAIPLAVFAVGRQTYTASSGRPLIIGSLTINSNEPAATIDGQKISLGSSGVNIGTESIPFSDTPVAIRPTVFTVNGDSITASPIDGTELGGSGGIVVSGSSLTMTLHIGGPTFTDGSQLYSAAPHGLVIGSSTINFPAGDIAATETGAAFSMKGSIFTAFETPAPGQDGGKNIIIPLGTTILTLEQGQSITLDGQFISFNGNDLRIGTTLQSLSTFLSAAPGAPSQRVIALLPISGVTYTATEFSDPHHRGQSEVVLPAGSMTWTLSSGGTAVTVNGQLVSDLGDGLVVGTSTVAFETVTETGAGVSSTCRETSTSKMGSGSAAGTHPTASLAASSAIPQADRAVSTVLWTRPWVAAVLLGSLLLM
ncbi:MAG: hypothetical protein Q9157_002006 [Trypethelium eluteriae]